MLQGFYNFNCIIIWSIVPKADPSADHGNRERERITETNVKFFKTHFNETLGKVAHDLSIKFNQIHWCSDRVATYIAGITRVNGNASLIKSCEDH